MWAFRRASLTDGPSELMRHGRRPGRTVPAWGPSGRRETDHVVTGVSAPRLLELVVDVSGWHPGAREREKYVVVNNVTSLPAGVSIQGEQQQAGWIRASDEDVDLYVDRVSDEVLACRERGRHLFPAIGQAGIYFTGVDSDGLFVRRLTCTCCALAVKVEKWEGTRRGGRTRFQRVASHLEYRTGPDGQSYLAPSGRGHMTARQIGDSVASKALQGQSLTALRKAAARAGQSGGGGRDGNQAG
jgi:hypothetical protein